MKPISSLVKRAKEEIKTDEDLVILTLVASLLACFAVIDDNSFYLLGAMLVYPLFNPVISLVVLLFDKKFKEALNAFMSVIGVVLLSLFISLLFFLAYTGFSGELYKLPVMDYSYFVNVSVAVLLGMVGMLLWLWPKAPGVSSGIAVAISLVPPIASIAAGFALGDLNYLTRSSIVLLINLFGIIFGGYVALGMKYKKFFG